MENKLTNMAVDSPTLKLVPSGNTTLVDNASLLVMMASSNSALEAAYLSCIMALSLAQVTFATMGYYLTPADTGVKSSVLSNQTAEGVSSQQDVSKKVPSSKTPRV